MKLTNATILGLEPPPGAKDALFFDEELSGFGIRVTHQGSRTFIVQYRTGGLRRRMAIGAYGKLAPDDARKAAKALLAKVALGGDPFGERKDKVDARRNAEAAAVVQQKADEFTFGKLITGWLDARAGDRRASYLDEAGRSLRRNFPNWNTRPAASITVAEAVHALDGIKLKAGPVSANRALSYARAVFAWAVRRQTLIANPFRGLERPARERSRERVLTMPEIGAIWRAAGAIGEPYGPAVRLLLLTLARRDEVAMMRWPEIDDQARPTTWTLPASRAKNGRSHVVHLVDAVAEVLRATPRQRGSDHVFPGQTGTGLTGWSNAMVRLRAALTAAGDDLGDWRLHDFRRSGVTYLAGAGVAPHVADRLLNHTTGHLGSIALVYQRHGFENERRHALDAWAAAVVAAAAGHGLASNVVALRIG